MADGQDGRTGIKSGQHPEKALSAAFVRTIKTLGK